MTIHRRIITTAAVALTLGAGATPASAVIDNAGPDSPGQPSSAPPTTVQPNPDQQFPGVASPTIVHVSAPSTGFDWGDAGIGAAGGLALSLIGIGGALAISQSRSRRATV